MASGAWARFFLGSHVLSSWGYPSHFTRYWMPQPRFLLFSISSTPYCSWSSMSSGGSRSSFSWLGNFPSLYGVSSVSLNTRCILHETGKFNRYADLPTFSITTKGPTCLSANLAFGHLVFRFSESSQTRVPFVYSYIFVFLCLS